MDLIQVKAKIESAIEALQDAQKKLNALAYTRAETEAMYDKKLALILMGIKNGQAYELEGVKVENPAVTVAGKIAKGLCYQEKIDMELADSNYKIGIKRIDTGRAVLNALQSLNKNFEVL